MALVADWDRAHGALPATLCGMAGSTMGWREVPYLPAPADPTSIAASALRFEAAGRPIAILPGVSCRNRLSAPDVMRGEEKPRSPALLNWRRICARTGKCCACPART